MNILVVSCFGMVVISLRGDITMDSQIHFPLSIIQLWPSLIMHENVLSSLNQAEAVRVCVCVCVNIPPYNLTLGDKQKNMWVGLRVNLLWWVLILACCRQRETGPISAEWHWLITVAGLIICHLKQITHFACVIALAVWQFNSFGC